MAWTPKQVAELVRLHPDASDEEIIQIARQTEAAAPKQTEEGWLEWANTPFLDIPETGNPVVDFGANVVEGLTSPLGIASLAAGGIGGAAGRLGLTALMRGGRAVEAATMLPGLLHGGYNLATGDSAGGRAAGALEAGLSALGLRGALRGAGLLSLRPAVVAADAAIPDGSLLSATGHSSATHGTGISRLRPFLAGYDADEVLDKILALHEANAGSTYNIYRGGDMGGQPFIAVALDPTRQEILKPGEALTRERLREFVKRNIDLLKNPDKSIGTWLDTGAKSPTKDHVYLDISTLVPEKELKRALTMGKKAGQKAVFNLRTFEEIKVPGMEGKVGGVEVAGAGDPLAVLRNLGLLPKNKSK